MAGCAGLLVALRAMRNGSKVHLDTWGLGKTSKKDSVFPIWKRDSHEPLVTMKMPSYFNPSGYMAQAQSEVDKED